MLARTLLASEEVWCGSLLTLPITYCGPSALGNRNGALMPPQFEMAMVTPVARAVAVEPLTVAVLWARKGITAALVHAIMKTAT